LEVQIPAHMHVRRLVETAIKKNLVFQDMARCMVRDLLTCMEATRSGRTMRPQKNYRGPEDLRFLKKTESRIVGGAQKMPGKIKRERKKIPWFF